jgi:hypothetical protein
LNSNIFYFPHSAVSYFETAVGVHGFSVFFSWQFLIDKTAATAVGRYFLNPTFYFSNLTSCPFSLTFIIGYSVLDIGYSIFLAVICPPSSIRFPISDSPIRSTTDNL